MVKAPGLQIECIHTPVFVWMRSVLPLVHSKLPTCISLDFVGIGATIRTRRESVSPLGGILICTSTYYFFSFHHGYVINKPGVARAVLQTPWSLIN